MVGSTIWSGLRGGRVAEDFAILNLEDAMGDVRDADVVRHDDDRLPELLVKPTEQVEDFLTGLRVEFPGWLIREEERLIVREGDPDGDPLLLATAQLIRAVAGALRHAHELEELLPAFRSNRDALPRKPQRQFDVLLCGEGGDQIEELEDEADPRKAILDEVAVPEVDEVGAVHLDPARGGPIDPADQIEQRCLATPRRPLDGHELFVRHLHVEAPERNHFGFPGSVD